MKFTICMLCVGCGLEKLEGDHGPAFGEVLNHCTKSFSFRLGGEELPACADSMRSAAVMEAKTLDADDPSNWRAQRN